MQLRTTMMNGVLVHEFVGLVKTPDGNFFPVAGDDFHSPGEVWVDLPTRDLTAVPPFDLELQSVERQSVPVIARCGSWSVESRIERVAFEVPQ